jgi:hypothetical protein
MGDLERIRARRPGAPRPVAAPEGILCVAWLETLVADDRRLFPNGIPREWWGESLEAHGVPTGPSSTVSLAVRWHGARPALLWEQKGAPVELVSPVVAPGWSSAAVSGEALWPAPG